MLHRIAVIFFTIISMSAHSTQQKIITFYQKGKPYYELTNFWMASFIIDDTVWPSVEHYFQAQKFIDPNIQEKIRKLETCMQAFYFARKPKLQHLILPHWHQGYKDAIMLKALRAKFSQNKDLRELLLSTGNAILVEDSNYDYYWGDPYYFDSKLNHGRNKLGKMLMQVRKELQDKKRH